MQGQYEGVTIHTDNVRCQDQGQVGAVKWLLSSVECF